jgi:predicted PurR-regulated permease PerM
LYVFVPGFLGGLTLYILSRDSYRYLTCERKWKKGWTAMIFLLAFLVCIGLPVFLAVNLLSSKITALFENSDEVMTALKSVSHQIKSWTGQDLVTDENINEIQKRLTSVLPSLLNTSVNVVLNLLMILFISFFMLTYSERMEETLNHFIPLKEENIGILADETKRMVRANAIGIPLISLIQGTFAMAGYWIFGINDFVLWGFITALFAFFPVIGTAMIWIPLIIYLFSTGNSGQAFGLGIYSMVVTGNIDYLARVTLLQKIGDVHPVIAVLGLIVGLKLFGFWGFIFGPLLISYFLLLLRIYTSEFGSMDSTRARS